MPVYTGHTHSRARGWHPGSRTGARSQQLLLPPCPLGSRSLAQFAISTAEAGGGKGVKESGRENRSHRLATLGARWHQMSWIAFPAISFQFSSFPTLLLLFPLLFSRVFSSIEFRVALLSLSHTQPPSGQQRRSGPSERTAPQEQGRMPVFPD